MKYYSQYGEDKFIIENGLLDINKKGYFVDIGAGDPTENSNTYFFEQRGWDGVCIDPDPNQTKKLSAIRKRTIKAAVANYDGRIKIDFHPHSELSRVSKNGKDEVICLKLSTIMEMPDIEKIDYLSIDVEGQEMEVLKSLPPTKYENMPQVIVIEYVSHIDGNHETEITDFLEKRGYEKVHKTLSNLIFKFKQQ